MTGKTPGTTFRRAFMDHDVVCVEIQAGEVYRLPNPTADGRRYQAATVLAAVIKAGVIDPALWQRQP